MCLSVGIAFTLIGCGGSNQTTGPSTSSPAPSAVTVTGTITDTVSGATVGSFTQTVAGLPPLLTISAPGYVTRQALIGRTSPMVDLIGESAPFSLDFYRELVRNGAESPDALQPLRMLTASPSIYFQRTGVSDDAHGVPPGRRRGDSCADWRPVVVSRLGDGRRAPRRHATMDYGGLIRDDDDCCGRALAGAAAGHIWLNTVPKCGRDGAIVSSPNLFGHELGHALGFWHVTDPAALMHAVVAADVSMPTERERFHAAIAYHRRPGNRDPDTDASTSAPLAARPARIIVD